MERVQAALEGRRQAETDRHNRGKEGARHSAGTSRHRWMWQDRQTGRGRAQLS